MHTTVSRAQNAFGFFTTVAFVVALFVAGSDYFALRNPSAEVKVGSGGVTVYVVLLCFALQERIVIYLRAAHSLN